MASYQPPQQSHWSGRTSNEGLYLHEIVQCVALSRIKPLEQQFAILGYSCDEGVRLNKGRTGAKDGPKAIRLALGKMPNHLAIGQNLADVGTISYEKGRLEATQLQLATVVTELLNKGCLPILLGGGHDIAYGHYNGIKNHLLAKKEKPTIGIINFDAHFDLRSAVSGANSGTPFYQIAKGNEHFQYLCLGIRKDANDKTLFQTAQRWNVTYLMKSAFRLWNLDHIKAVISDFISKVNVVYVTIDLDGFSSAYAPGVSAASPMGFSPEVVIESLNIILKSKKLISLDIAEMNPKYDLDGQTAKLAASLVHHIIHAGKP